MQRQWLMVFCLTIAVLACNGPTVQQLPTAAPPGGGGGDLLPISSTLNEPHDNPFLDDPTAPGIFLPPTNTDENTITYSSSEHVTALAFDGQSVWAGTNGGGLTAWDTSTQLPSRHTPENGLPLSTVLALAADPASRTLFVLNPSMLVLGNTDTPEITWQTLTIADLLQKADLTLFSGSRFTDLTIQPGSTYLWLALKHPTQSNAYPSLIRYNWETSAIDQIPIDSTSQLASPINDLNFGPDGALWVATGSASVQGSISTFLPSGVWQQFVTQPSFGLTADYYIAVQVDVNGVVYAAHPNGLNYKLPNEGNFLSYENGVATMLAPLANGVLLGTNSQLTAFTPLGLDGVFPYPPPVSGPAPSRVPPVVVPDATPTPLPPLAYANRRVLQQPVSSHSTEQSVLAALYAPNGSLWFGGVAGLYSLSPAGTYQQHSLLADLLSNDITRLAVNPMPSGGHAIWIEYGGAASGRFSRLYQNRITHYLDAFHAIQDAYPWLETTALWPTSIADGLIWLEIDGTFWVYNGTLWQSIQLPSAYGEQVLTYTVGANGFLAIITEQGLVRYRPNSGWLPPTSPPAGNFTNLRDIKLVGNNLFVLGGQPESQQGGLFQFGLNTEIWTVHSGQSGLPPAPIVEMWHTATEGLWLVSHSGIFANWRPQQNDFHTTATQLTNVQQVVASENGLYLVSDKSVVILAEGAGSHPNALKVFDGPITALAVEPEGYCWVASSNGLTRLPPP